MTFVIEFEGYNDGKPYEKARFKNIWEARDAFFKHRYENPKVRWRLIRLDYDWSN